MQVSVTNSRTGSFGMVDSDDGLLRSNDLAGTNSGNTYRERLYSKRISNGFVLVDVFTNRLDAAQIPPTNPQ